MSLFLNILEVMLFIFKVTLGNQRYNGRNEKLSLGYVTW